tara:strand:+ start:197 stop:694 length:498 start_codon:yes stop_codon:yes gene_type:complete
MPRTNTINPLDKMSYFIVDFIVPYLIKLNVHPNLITLLGFIPIYFVYINIISKKRFFAYFFGFINYTLDCLDGELARQSGKMSKLGGMLDSLHDLTSFFTLLYLAFGLYSIPILLIVLLSVVMIFKMDLLKHTPGKNKELFYFVHDNLDILYYICIEITFRYINR